MSLGRGLWGQTMYEIVVARDDDGRYFIVRSDIIGLHAESDSLDELQAIILDLAPELIAANHRKVGLLSSWFAPKAPRIKFSQDLCLAS